MFKEVLCSRDSGPIRDLSDSTGVRAEACFTSKWNTSGNRQAHIYIYPHVRPRPTRTYAGKIKTA